MIAWGGCPDREIGPLVAKPEGEINHFEIDPFPTPRTAVDLLEVLFLESLFGRSIGNIPSNGMLLDAVSSDIVIVPNVADEIWVPFLQGGSLRLRIVTV